MVSKDVSSFYPFLAVGITAALVYLAYIIYRYAKTLNQSPRELWLVSLSQVFEFIAWALMLDTLTLFLTSDVGLSDMKVGSIMGVWTTGYTILMFGVGALVDAVGVKRILVIGTICAIISRCAFAMTTNIYLLGVFGFVIQAVSVAFMSPVITVAMKRYTKRDTSAMGFALFYTLMNIGFAIGGWLFDFFRNTFGEYGHIVLPLVGEITTYRFILIASFLLSIPALILINIMRDGLDLKDDGTLEITPPEKRAEGPFFSTLIATVKKAFVEAGQIFITVAKQPAFWKFMLLLAMLLGVNYVFYHFHYTFPKYGIRVFGEGAKVGTVYGVLNPVIVIFLVPLIGYLTRTWSSYLMITFGTILSAGSVFLVTIPERFYMPLVDTWFGRLIWQVWLGQDAATDPSKLALYIAFTFFVGIFTIGEAIWSPRLMEYTARIAPKGQEASYMSLSLLPKFLSQPLVAVMSGWLLARYVPIVEATGVAEKTPPVVGDISHHHMVWLWVGAIAILSPLGMLLFKKWISCEDEHPHDSELAEKKEPAAESASA